MSPLSLTQMNGDTMTFTARLLDVGIRKVYSLNRQICVVKLPAVFSALAEILAREHEEAIFAAMVTFKSLIDACIDQCLIKQGIDQIVVNEDGGTRSSGTTIIEKICLTIESLLGYQYNAVWDMAFQVVSAMFDKLGTHSFYLLSGTLRAWKICRMPNRKQLHDCVGSALGATGPENLLSSSLSFFTKSILGMVGAIRHKSRQLEQEGRIFSSRGTEALVYSLWSLLPAFCNYPIDTANSFKGLQKALCSTLRDDPDVRGVICSSLQILIKQNKNFLEENNDLPNNEIVCS
ncbi:hypothetical protein GIB67_014766 [Kingdonia uniflora]|uniref:RRP12 HEAT domain-containing protein n=1 Tax=Kingdonia uniflora TaxID=39325 RepID=A0A7J7NUW0_9MAGN|nr:hypothetical protein GIB67_014766 [Kingdonia uniflora]